MAWKQDLARLKQQLGPEAPPPALKPAPRPAPKAADLPALADEDAVFLSAMGLRPASARPAKPASSEDATASPGAAISPVPESFEEAVKDLTGFKPLVKGPLDHPRLPKSPAPPDLRNSTPIAVVNAVPLPDIPPPGSADPEPTGTGPASAIQSSSPTRFQLAAGMAIEVDGTLDLRGHSLTDAKERLVDRLGDGVVLGWRSLHLHLGQDSVLHEGLLALLASGEVSMVSRFAQAPVPMGGTQAWVLYFSTPPTQS